MTRRLIIRPAAETDITRAAIWYEDRVQGLGQEVLSEIRAAISRALQNPEAFPRVRERPNVHRILVHRFPYRLFYILGHKILVVFAVLHAARNERHWMSRV